MNKYWKLIDLLTHEYTTHETEEEVNHMIEHLTRDMDDDKIIRRVDIKTPFANYDFQHIIVYNPQIVRHFIYFFDSIEEQCDAFEEELHEKESTICEQQKRLSKFNAQWFFNGVTRAEILEAGLDESEKTNEFLRKEIRRLENEVGRLKNIIRKSDEKDMSLPTTNQTINVIDHINKELCDEVEYLKETVKSKEHRIDVLEAEKKILVQENKELQEVVNWRTKLLDQIRNMVHPF